MNTRTCVVGAVLIFVVMFSTPSHSQNAKEIKSPSVEQFLMISRFNVPLMK